MQKIIPAVVVALLASMTASHAAAPSCSALLKQGCACAAPIPASGNIVSLSQVSGDVSLGRDIAATPVSTGAGLGINDQVSVGEGGRALLSVAGQCKLNLVGPQKIVVKSVGGCACVASLTAETADRGFDLAVPEAGGGVSGSGASAIGGGLATGGIVTGIALAAGGGMLAALSAPGAPPQNISCAEARRRVAALANQINQFLGLVRKNVWGPGPARAQVGKGPITCS